MDILEQLQKDNITLRNQIKATNDNLSDMVTHNLDLIMKLKGQIYKLKFDLLRERMRKVKEPELIWSRDGNL
jgi:hypothetical protein